ncbi:MAG: hypothetical protein JSW21_06650 [Gammaproteobacteria bacterium]|nr:MAG: hypothetical protein JSW21_06650 [Gammaproteobacteria bacterium]
MARGRKPKNSTNLERQNLEIDADSESEDGFDNGEETVMSEDDDFDSEVDTLELPALSEISGAAESASARRRVEEYLEMKRAARDLHDLEDFDFE